LAARQQIVDRLFQIRDLGVPEQRPIEDRAPPIDHPYQQALRILGKMLEARHEDVVLIRQDRAVGSSNEREHLDEMVVVIIDREIRPFHSQRLLAILNHTQDI
jgi:hypothetical protein